VTAVPADPPDEAVAGHYGDPYREQRRLADGAGAVDLSHREVVRVSGPDRLGWLHSLLSQHVADLQPGESREALVLSPHGHVEHHLHLVETGDAVLAHVEPGTAEQLRAFLDSMRFMLRVEVAAADELAVVWTPGSAPAGEVAATSTGFGRYALVPRTELAAALGDEPAGVMAHEALRVAALRPRLGLDTDHRTLPHEVGWLVSAVHLDGSDVDLPAVGSPLVLGEREVGRVGTAVRHHELGPLALALVKRQVPDDAELLAGGVPARIDETARIAEPESDARLAADVRASFTRLR
jgi:folate-binding Fe-S cluster repair protein YgfZ